MNVNWIGDVLFSTPAIRAIKKRYPKSFLACLVPKRCVNILNNNPYLDEIIVGEDRAPFYALFKHMRMISALRQRRFDSAIFFHRSKTRVLWAWLAGVRERVGYQDPGKKRLLTKSCPRPGTEIHKTDYFLRLLEFLGIPADGREPDFYPRKEALPELAELLRGHGILPEDKYIVVHPGGNWDLKRWPSSYFSEWIRLFIKRSNWKVILCGTISEESLCKKILSEVQNPKVISFCGKTSIDTLALLLKNAELLVSNDSGPIHLAASQGTEIIGLFGPTTPALTGPISRGRSLILRKDVGCEIPCYFRSCDHRVCMEWLKPEEVHENTLKFLDQRS